MAGNRWRRIEEVLDAALAAGPSEWSTVLDHHCREDPELRKDVESLLRQVGSLDQFLAAPPASVAAALIGDVERPMPEMVASRYRIRRRVGHGPTASVYEATDERDQRTVAVKVLRTALVAVVGVARFVREIEVAGRLQHPNILPLLDSGTCDDTLYYVTPFVVGGTLGDLIGREGPLSVAVALRLSGEIAAALSEAHRQGIVHRDIKPNNVLLESGRALVADFGIARAMGTADKAAVTRTGVILGTPPYLSPEQAAGAKDVDPRADQYSLACVVFEMLAGRPPFQGRADQVRQQHLTARPPPVDRYRSDLPSTIVAALDRALAKAPADRFADVDRFAAALRASPPG